MAKAEEHTTTIAKKHILNEGELRKKGGFFRKWQPRFVVLNEEMLMIFKRNDDESRGRPAKLSVSLNEISSIENHESKKKTHCFRFSVESKNYIFCCPTELARDLWVRMIKEAKLRLNEPKEHTVSTSSSNNPTVTINQLNPGLKEVRIERQKGQGLGCTIKSVGGVISVNRILEDGPVSTTGVLRPGDEIIEVNGIKVSGFSPSEISEIIKGSPEIVVCTIRPYDSVTFADRKKNLNYTEIDTDKTAKLNAEKKTEEKDKYTSATQDEDEEAPPDRPPRADRNVTYKNVQINQTNESQEPMSRIKHSYAYEYEDDMITAASQKNASISEQDENTEKATGNTGSVTLPRSLSKRENGLDREYENVFIGASGKRNSLPLIRKLSGEEAGLNYAYLDFSEAIENNEPHEEGSDLHTKEKISRKRSNSLPVKSTRPDFENNGFTSEGENHVKHLDPQTEEKEDKSNSTGDDKKVFQQKTTEPVYPRVKYPYAELDFGKKDEDQVEDIPSTDTESLLT